MTASDIRFTSSILLIFQSPGIAINIMPDSYVIDI
jgi:hypothetical protein